MEKYEISKFIDKTISKTKKNELTWKTLKEDTVVKPLPNENAVFNPLEPVLGQLSIDDSYIAQFHTGTLLLLVFSASFPQLLTPPDGCTISLRIQDEKSKYAVEISNTCDDEFNASELIRLYNLIDKDSSSLHSLIDNFLNS